MSFVLLGADLVAILVLVFGTFLPRHKRRDLVVAYLGINLGVLALTSALASSTVSAGLGLGLFGVLSIIRLRSEELSQHEIAYYFAAITVGLLGGLSTANTVWVISLMAAVVAAIVVGDSPALVGRSMRQVVVLDRAHTDPASARAHVESVLGGTVHDVTVTRTDLVNDTTVVTIRHTPAVSLDRSAAAERIDR